MDCRRQEFQDWRWDDRCNFQCRGGGIRSEQTRRGRRFQRTHPARGNPGAGEILGPGKRQSVHVDGRHHYTQERHLRRHSYWQASQYFILFYHLVHTFELALNSSPFPPYIVLHRICFFDQLMYRVFRGICV